MAHTMLNSFLKQHHQFLKCYSQMFDDSILLVRVNWSGPVVHLSS